VHSSAGLLLEHLWCRDVLYSLGIAVHDRIGLLQRGMRRLWAVQLSPSRGRLLAARRQQLGVLQWRLSVGAVYVLPSQLPLPDERRMLQRGVRSVPESLPVVRPAAPAHMELAARSTVTRLPTYVSDGGVGRCLQPLGR
jgi:hypothetical protein